MVATSFLLASLFAAALGNPLARRAMQVHESRAGIPTGFTKTGSADPNTVLNMRIALTQNDPKGLEAALMEVSTPGNKLYGQHLSKEEVEAFVTPSQDTVSAVNAWLSENKITAEKITPTGDWLSFQVTVQQANEMLNTEFATFQHEESGQTSIRTLAYSVPADLAEHIALVHPTVTFTRPSKKLPIMSIPRSSQSTSGKPVTDATPPASCDSIITPTCLQDLYGIPATPASGHATLGVSGFIDQFANEADLKTFLADLRPDIPSTTTFTLQTLDGGTNTQTEADAGVEADLDTQYTIGNAAGVPVTFISVGERTKDGDLSGFLDIINFLLGESSPPQVLTTSYGQNEDDISVSLANQLCNAYTQLGARGVSILFSSGDGGVGGSQSTSCRNFLATFPSGCPFMTSVGATTGIPETSASFSSGGFSNIFGTASYQEAAVSAYLTKLGSTESGKFNRSGRAFPDVAAMGDNVEIVFQQEAGLVAGTSCSSPIFASIISLINDQLIAAGKSPLGFLNPFLYGPAASTFTDITTGNNPGCNTNGFPAEAGWDPITGLGTPNFQALLNAALAAAS